MTNDLNVNINLNKFLKDISTKKQYIKRLQNQSSFLNNIKQKNYKSLTPNLLHYKNTIIRKNSSMDNIVLYIIDITFSRSNTFLNVMDSSGKLKFFCSAGHLQYKGKNKKFRFTVFKSIFHVLTTKLKFLKDKPIALHLKNVGFNRFWIIKKLKAKFFIKTVKSFNVFPYNGCRKRKVRRKKFKKRRNG